MNKKELLTRKRIRSLAKGLKPYITIPEEITFPSLIKKVLACKKRK